MSPLISRRLLPTRRGHRRESPVGDLLAQGRATSFSRFSTARRRNLAVHLNQQGLTAISLYLSQEPHAHSNRDAPSETLTPLMNRVNRGAVCRTLTFSQEQPRALSGFDGFLPRCCTKLAQGAGLEPATEDLESPVLPLKLPLYWSAIGESNSFCRTGGPVHKPICQSRIFKWSPRRIPPPGHLLGRQGFYF